MLDLHAESKVWLQEEMQREDVMSYEGEPSSSSSAQCWANELLYIASPLWEPKRKHAKQLEWYTFTILTSMFSVSLFHHWVEGSNDITPTIPLVAVNIHDYTAYMLTCTYMLLTWLSHRRCVLRPVRVESTEPPHAWMTWGGYGRHKINDHQETKK